MRVKMLAALGTLALCGMPLLQAQTNFAAEKVAPFHIKTWGLADVMRLVSEKTGLTVGVELDEVPVKAGTLELDFPGGTVADLAAQCAALKTGALWKIVNNRSLLIFVPGKATALSEQRIAYGGVSLATRRQVWTDLPNHPEIANWLESAGCQRQEIFMGVGGDWWGGDQPTISMSSGRMNLGDIIEAAASQSSHHYWSIVNDQSGGNCLISIFF